jgi:hypothetical protein
MARRSHLRFGFDPLALDEDTADRLLSGTVPPADAPPGYGEVARVVQAAVAPVLLEGEAAMVAAMQAEMATSPKPERRKNVLTKLLTAKAAAIAITGTLSMTGAAAATGSLPAPAQEVANHVASTVGVDLPAPAERPHVEPPKRPEPTPTTEGHRERHETSTTRPTPTTDVHRERHEPPTTEVHRERHEPTTTTVVEHHDETTTTVVHHNADEHPTTSTTVSHEGRK